MSGTEWVDVNNRYLASSLQWLRLRLDRIGKDNVTSHNADQQLRNAAAERERLATSNPPPALVVLAERLSLSAFERDTLLLCAAPEFDSGMAGMYSAAQATTSRNQPTFGLAMSVFDDPSWDALSPNRPLRYLRLIEIVQSSGAPLLSSPVKTDERVVNFLKGLNVLDDSLATLLTPVTGQALLSQSQQEVADAVLARLRQSAYDSVVPVVQFAGVDEDSQVAIALQVCETLQRRLYRLNQALPVQSGELETFSRTWQRENFLLPVALYLDAAHLETGAGDSIGNISRFLSRGTGLIFVGVRDTPLRLSIPTIAVDVKKPTAPEQRGAWQTVLNGRSDASTLAQRLAGQFNLNLTAIHGAVSNAAAVSKNGAVGDQLWDACRDITRPQLDQLAQRLEPKATWDDLVLPEEQMKVMRQICGQVRERHRVYDEWGFSRSMNRGFGITALFAGESGTGKTMGTEVIANDLRLNLYRIDLSAVVSKYIGETEKNLRKLFDAAEQGGAILFFDEADALFGKRSEVKDSHDRYANIEINYLLQRMEAFNGLAILATNMKSALDSAFMRRLRFIVNFPYPGIEERRKIWQRSLPAETPKESLDYDRLAKLNISGGNIHSIALNAAFAAAQEGQPVTMPLLLSAARTEMRKLNKAFSEMEFR